MARKGGKRGGSSAARSAAAKKGWETRRRGGAKAKPAATKRTAASKAKAKPASKPTARRGMPKTTSARGRALTNQRRAADLVRASRGGKGLSAKAVRSVLTAQRARAFYAATGAGKKRSAVKAAGKKATAAKAAAVRSRLGGGGSARAKVASGAARKVAKAPKRASKVDLTDAGFTRRLGRAKASLQRAQAAYAARGSSIYDTAARRRVSTLQSAVDTLSYARKTVRNNTVPASKISKAADKALVDNYNRQLAATKRRAASTPLGGRRTTAPKLTRTEKAAATRARNKAARDAEQRRRWEQSRRYG